MDNCFKNTIFEFSIVDVRYILCLIFLKIYRFEKQSYFLENLLNLTHFKTSHENYLEPLLSWFVHKVPNVTVKELEGIGKKGKQK